MGCATDLVKPANVVVIGDTDYHVTQTSFDAISGCAEHLTSTNDRYSQILGEMRSRTGSHDVVAKVWKVGFDGIVGYAYFALNGTDGIFVARNYIPGGPERDRNLSAESMDEIRSAIELAMDGSPEEIPSGTGISHPVCFFVDLSLPGRSKSFAVFDPSPTSGESPLIALLDLVYRKYK